MRKLVLIATLVALTGCAASYREISVSADHPVSPSTTEAPLPTHVQTLNLAAVGWHGSRLRGHAQSWVEWRLQSRGIGGQFLKAIKTQT